jgi:hypothetical protein
MSLDIDLLEREVTHEGQPYFQVRRMKTDRIEPFAVKWATSVSMS